MKTDYHPGEITGSDLAKITRQSREQKAQRLLRTINDHMVATASIGHYQCSLTVECDQDMATMIENQMIDRGIKVSKRLIRGRGNSGLSYEFDLNWRENAKNNH